MPDIVQKELCERIAELEAQVFTWKERFYISERQFHEQQEKRKTLEAENAILGEDIKKHVALYQTTIALSERLQAENTALRKDAARYRFLRSNSPLENDSPFICICSHGTAFSQWIENHADAVIDDAMPQKERK